MPGGYGAMDGGDAPASRRPALVSRRILALALASVALVACAAVVGFGARGAAPAALLAPGPPQGQQLVAVMQGPRGESGGEFARKSRRTLALEAYLSTVCAPPPRLDVAHGVSRVLHYCSSLTLSARIQAIAGAESLDDVDHAALAAGLRAHLCVSLPPPKHAAPLRARPRSMVWSVCVRALPPRRPA